jgi:Family of unknown function (DUF6152)
MTGHRFRDALLVALAVSVITARQPLAHHGTTISYDQSKRYSVKAVVTEFKYVNPHTQLFFDVTDEKGNVTHWAGELLPNPAMLIRNGWTRKRSAEALPYGTKVVVTAAPPRAGGNTVLVLKIENEKGEDLLGLGATPGPPGPPPAR